MSAKHIRILLVLGFVLSVCHLAAAQECWSYMDEGVFECGGAGGCESFYFRTGCMLGCVSGSCNPDGNSGECCGQRYYYAQGYQWGSADCHGLNCGESPVRRARRQESRGGEVRAAALNPDFALLAYRAPRILFVPDRCTHEYDAIFENFPALPKGGM